MKDILLINNKPKATGIGNYSFSLYENLKKITNRNIDFITLASSFADSGSAIKVFPQNIKKIAGHAAFLRQIPRSYKVYHVLSPNIGILLPRLQPSVVTVHDVLVLKNKIKKDILAKSYGLELPLVLGMQLNMQFVKKADRVLCMSNYTKNDLISTLGIENKRITVTYPGIDTQLYHPRDRWESRKSLNLPSNKRIILHVGTDEPRKNSATLIEAFHLVRKKIPEVILVKIGGMREATRKLILSRGLADSVIHLKKVPSVAPYYNAADVFVFPSYYEGFGYPAAEAMASGCPVIAADSSSLSEVVGEGGVLFPTFDVIVFQDLMMQVLTDAGKAADTARKGLEQAKKFDWKKCAETTLAVYETL
jgi:glycosyltransferase involved in cell wall biosynthesis